MQPASFGPGQTLPINVGDFISSLKASVVSIPFTSITKCAIRRSIFIFDDGMKWDGAYSTPDAMDECFRSLFPRPSDLAAEVDKGLCPVEVLDFWCLAPP
jgi:hypothetical protein